MITWQTPAGSLGKITERIIIEIPLSASSNIGSVSYSVIAGSLPRGLRLSGNKITGSPVEVKRYTESRFVVRASDGVDLEDRTFSISVDGADIPEWVTTEGFLKVGPGEAYFVLDNSYVNFQLEATDTDLTAGDKLEYFLIPTGGQLPPGLNLSVDGVISGFTDPIFAVDYISSDTGSYDTGAFDVTPLDFSEAKSNGFDSYFYDNQTFDYTESSRIPRRLSRIYTFAVAVSDGANTITRIFKIYVVTEEFLQADNSLLQVDTNLFQADSSKDRIPLWITESNLGRYRSNNYLTIFLDVYDPPSLSGTLTFYLLSQNPDGTTSEIPPGTELDSITGEIAGKIPYQSAVTKTYKFTMLAVNFSQALATTTYTLAGNWNSVSNYPPNYAVKYEEDIYVSLIANRNIIPTNETYWLKGTSSAQKTFTIELVGEIESSVEWITPSDRGTIKPNQPSRVYVEAQSLLYGGRIAYEFVSGSLPPGLTFLPTGDIQGKVKQFADAKGPGLTRFFDGDSSYDDSSGDVKTFDITFDGESTSFDKKFTFTIKAKDAVNFAELNRIFTVTVVADNQKTFANLYLKAFQSKNKRLDWYNFITDATIFKPEDIYRYGDENYGIQSDLKVLVFAGIESVSAVNYIQAMSRNHYKKRLLFGDVKVAKGKDQDTQEVMYEVIYVDIVDEFEKSGKSVAQTQQLSNGINSRVLISYDAIKVDSNIPFVSDRDHQRIFPNSLKNMRTRIEEVGERDRELLPLWMRSIQEDTFVEPGYVKSLVICYAKPGKADAILARIKAKTQYASRGEWSSSINYTINDSVLYKGLYYTCILDNNNKIPNTETDFWTRNFDFKSIDFLADRYLIDIIDGEIEDKYLAFPQRGEKLP
jgi:hypothetical protein